MNAPAHIDPLTRLRSAGLTVTLESGKLFVRPASALTDDDRQILREHRAFILSSLNAEHAARETEHAAREQVRIELTALVRQCGDAYGFSDDEHADALRIALADSASALVCFRAMARELADTLC